MRVSTRNSETPDSSQRWNLTKKGTGAPRVKPFLFVIFMYFVGKNRPVQPTTINRSPTLLPFDLTAPPSYHVSHVFP